MFELNGMGLLEVALRQRITLQGVLPLLAEKTRKCKFQPENAIQNMENIKGYSWKTLQQMWLNIQCTSINSYEIKTESSQKERKT